MPDWPQPAANVLRRRAAHKTCVPIGREATFVRQHGRRLVEPAEKAGPDREGGGGRRRGAARTERPRESSAPAAMEDGVYGTAVAAFNGGRGVVRRVLGMGEGAGEGGERGECGVSRDNAAPSPGKGERSRDGAAALRGGGRWEATPPWLPDHAPSGGLNGTGAWLRRWAGLGVKRGGAMGKGRGYKGGMAGVTGGHV